MARSRWVRKSVSVKTGRGFRNTVTLKTRGFTSFKDAAKYREQSQSLAGITSPSSLLN